MTIHVVQEGDTISSIAQQYQVDMERLIIENGLVYPDNLAIGQTIVILKPLVTYTVKEGDTLANIALQHDVPVIQLLQNNPYLANREFIYPGETIVITYDSIKTRNIEIAGYAYPFISKDVLLKTLPYLTYLTVFNYRITLDGELVDIDDQEIVDLSKSYGVVPAMMVSTFSPLGVASPEVTATIINNAELQDKLIDSIVTMAKTKGYLGVNHTLFFLNPQNATLMENYVKKLSERLKSEGLLLVITISPKVNIDRTQVFYDNIDFAKLSQYVYAVLILSYDWGYSLGPPASATPVNITEQVLKDVSAKVPHEIISLGFPVIGYDWKLPYIPGETKAHAITPEGAVSLAFEMEVAIKYNQTSQSPYFFYTINDDLHNVWFTDARSISALSDLVIDNELNRIAIWNIMSFFNQMWLVLNNNFNIRKVLQNPALFES